MLQKTCNHILFWMMSSPPRIPVLANYIESEREITSGVEGEGYNMGRYIWQ